MIGNGIDIIEIDRIQEACLKWGKRFLNRIYTPQEQIYCSDSASQVHKEYGGLTEWL